MAAVRRSLTLYFLQMLFVSYTILAVTYICAGMFTEIVDEATYSDLLVLFVITFFVCLWNILVKDVRYTILIRYLGDLAIVLGIGYAYDGFISFSAAGTLTACAILAIVYMGTWLYFYAFAVLEAGQINRRLASRVRQKDRQ